jgi:hypothetical protein
MIIFKGASDTPIVGKKHDELNRAVFAERFARLITTFSGDERSNIFALYGEWGSGKTSVWNMVRAEISRNTPKPQIVEFSPWAYSSANQVLCGFFFELLAVLGRKPVFNQVATAFGNFRDGLTAIGSIGLMVAGADPTGTAGALSLTALTGAKAASKVSKAAKTAAALSLSELRTKVEKALINAKQPILIMVDDVDRLPPIQVAALFQLIRVNASLPMVNYLLLMDRASVEQALVKEGFAKTYLEKIVQFGIDLPRLAPEDLRVMGVRRALSALEGSEKVKLGKRIEQAVATSLGVLTTPRSIGRIAESFRFHLGFFRDGDVLEVDPVDLFLLEVLRCQAPALYAFIRDETGTYVDQASLLEIYFDKDKKVETERKQKVAAVIAKQPEFPAKALQDIFDALVPGYSSSRHSRQDDFAHCRLCSAPHFRNFFELTVPRQHPSQAQLEAIRKSSGNQKATHQLVYALIEAYGQDVVISALDARFKGETDPKVLTRLLTALWAIDLARLHMRGPGTYLLPTVGIANFTIECLRKISAAAKCEEVLKAVRAASSNFGLLYRIVASEQHDTRISQAGYKAILPADVLKRLRRECSKEADRILTSDAMIREPMLTWFLGYKAEAEGPEKVRALAAGLLSDKRRLAGFLKNAIRMHRQVPPDEELVLTSAVLTCYFTIDQALVDATRDLSGLEVEDRKVLQQANAIALETLTNNPAIVPNDEQSPRLMNFVPGLV